MSVRSASRNEDAYGPVSPVVDQPAHDYPRSLAGNIAATPLNGLSLRRRNPRRGFEIMKMARGSPRSRQSPRRVGATLTLSSRPGRCDGSTQARGFADAEAIAASKMRQNA